MHLVYIIGPANPEAVMGLLILALLFSIGASIYMYFGMAAAAGSILVLLLNFIGIPYLLIRTAQHAGNKRWLRMLLCLALVPVIGWFTYNESRLTYHSNGLLAAIHDKDVPLARIKYAVPVSEQAKFVGAPERLHLLTTLFGSYGLSIARQDATLYEYMKLANFQRVCVTRDEVADAVDDWQELREIVFARAGLTYFKPSQREEACTGMPAMQRNFGVDVSALLKAELQTSREYYAKAVAMGGSIAKQCEGSRNLCSVYAMQVSFTNDGSMVYDCDSRNGCQRITVPDPTAHITPDMFARARNGAQIYANMQHDIALLKGETDDGCYGSLCAMTRTWLK